MGQGLKYDFSYCNTFIYCCILSYSVSLVCTLKVRYKITFWGSVSLNTLCYTCFGKHFSTLKIKVLVNNLKHFDCQEIKSHVVSRQPILGCVTLDLSLYMCLTHWQSLKIRAWYSVCTKWKEYALQASENNQWYFLKAML